MFGRHPLVVLATFGLLLFQTSTALASTASVTGFDLDYTAAPGETNAVVVTVFGPVGSFLRISDPGATISAGPGCVPSGADVLCENDAVFEVVVDLGDGDDSANLAGIELAAIGTGGPGNDQIVGAVFDNLLSGGPGNDHLTGDGGDDSLHGGEGDDQLFLGAGEFDMAFGGPGNDTISGGPGGDDLHGDSGDDTLTGGSGLDLVSAGGMNLRLTPTTLVGQGNDTLSGVEWVQLSGGNGNNVINARTWRGRTNIRARGGNDVIVGGSGRDVVSAGAGNDRLAGGGGRDLLAGEAGNDLLLSRDREPDQVGGGPGLDRAHVDRIDRTRLIETFLP